MYFPYLCGRQAELLALRDFSQHHPFDNTVLPIIEPVKADQGNLLRALAELSKGGFVPLVILNPSRLDFKHGVDSNWVNQLLTSSQGNSSFIPAIYCNNQVDFNDVISFLRFFGEKKVAVVYGSSRLSAAEILAIDQSPHVIWEVVMPNSLGPQERAAVSSTKAVDIANCFNVQARNADYNGMEFFSNQHLTFRQYSVGYGDYTALATTVSETGGPASAVAIHPTYKNSDTGEVWVEHFVSSNTQQGSSTTARKFLDAAGQLCAQVAARPNEFGNNAALTTYADQVASQHFPGLTENKRQQILHHLCLNRQILLGEI